VRKRVGVRRYEAACGVPLHKGISGDLRETSELRAGEVANRRSVSLCVCPTAEALRGSAEYLPLSCRESKRLSVCLL
jgi:hypothetical protein